MGRDSSKPGRPSGERWVLHASEEFSRVNLESTAETINELLSSEFEQRFGGKRAYSTVHRWRYASAVRQDGALFEWDEEYALGLCGDALAGEGVEAAWSSAMALSEVL